MTGMVGRRTSRIGIIPLPVRRLHVELTSRCNFSCEFCPDRPMQRPRGTMPLPTLACLLSEAGQEGLARQVHFHVMGEPLLYPDLIEAVRMARGNGLETWVTTNGSLLTPEVLTDLAEARLAHLTLSLQTPDAATFALRGVRHLSFEAYRERVIAAARAAVACQAEMRLSICFLVNPLRRFRAPTKAGASGRSRGFG